MPGRLRAVSEEQRRHTPTVDQQVRQYTAIRPLYGQFAKLMSELLRTLLDSAGIRYHAIEHRAKTIESFREKIQRPGKDYDSALAELPDLCGLRAILFYAEDVRKVADLVREEFGVDTKQSVDKATELGADQFGYQSLHLVISLSSERSKLTEWRAFQELHAELQIRTVLQHSWAAISQALQYKTEDAVPRHLRRRLSRLSGLLELADQEFASLRKAHQKLEKSMARASDESIAEATIDRVSLAEFMSRSETVSTLVAAGKSGGFTIKPERDERALETLAWACSRAELETVADLERSLAGVEALQQRFFEKAFQNSGFRTWKGNDSFMCVLALVLAHSDRFTEASLVESGWEKDNAKAVVGAALVVAEQRTSASNKAMDGDEE